MEDFEYSVEISDRDWECFFAECEQCNLLPPSLASLDDSGMSDLDDTASILAKRAQKVDLTAGFSEADRPIDGPPDCEGSPVEHYLSKHGVGGMESVLSGSEEDIHLQCVNIFFERLKNVTEAEKLAEPSQVGAGKNREVAQEEESCSDGQQARSNTSPRNIPKSNSLPARGETAVGKETTKPVDTISNIIKTIKKDEPGSNIFPEPAAYNSVLKTNKSAHPETKLFIVKEACTETKVNEVTQQSQSHDSPDRVKTTPHTDKVIKVDMYTSLDDSKLEDYSHLILSKTCSTDGWSNLEMVTNVKWKEDLNVSRSDATSSSKTASQESSPSASIKRKRRKKRRLSAEPAECVYGYERQGLVRPSDSDEEQNAWRGGTSLCVPEDINLFYLNDPQKNFVSATANDLPVKILTKDLSHYSPPIYNQYQNLPESVVRKRSKDMGSTENSSTNNSSPTPLSQTEDSVMSASSNSGNLSSNFLQFSSCSKLQVEESPELNKCPGSGTDGVNGESYLDTETANDGRKDAHAGSLQQSDKMNHSTICCQKEQTSTAEVKSLTHSIFPSAKSSDLPVEVSQSVKLSAAKSVLAEEAGHSGRDNHTLCQREAEPQQQLEIDCHYKDQYSSTLEKTHFPLSAANGMSSSGAHNTKPEQLKTRGSEFLAEISTQLMLDTSTSLPDKCCVTNSPTSLDKHLTVQQIEHPLVFHPSSKLAVLLEKNSAAERAKVAGSQITAFHNGDPLLSVEINGKSQRETKLSVSEDLLTTPSDITPLSSCCTLDTESVMSLSNENISDMSGSYCSSVSQSDSRGQGEKTSLILAKHEEGEGPKNQSVSSETKDSKCDLVLETGDVVTPVSKAECEPEKEPDSKCSVFAMSSFWSEMEKLTINDILGLRMMNKAATPSALPPLQESEETGFAMTDSGFFTQLDESKPEQIIEDTLSDPKSVESSLGSVSSRGFMWDSEPVPVSLGADIYTENMLTSISDISQPPGSAQTGLRKICKNVSVHNLPALESFSYTWKSQTLQTLNEGGLEKVEYLTDGHVPKQDKDTDSLASSVTDSYKISLTDIFQYLFGGKQSTPSQAATDNISTCYIDGNSVPETYDHFFSEFDTESFFYPLITADQSKDELVPVFSFSRSANRNLQFPEAYDHFFASSSSDDSSVESDEEDNCAPVRVVSRFTRTSSSSKLCTDMYDNFFSDSDLKQNFFWKNALSFRNVSFTASTVQKQTLSNSLVPVKQRSGRSPRRTVHPINALGNQDVIFSDPLLMHLEDRISRQLAQQPFRYEDLQTAVSNPRLDSSLLPLRQSDMCLVCIAFASWVLKTANPQVGDAWKAVLLANVSALSAIRYLRKYVKMEVADSERNLQITAPSDS